MVAKEEKASEVFFFPALSDECVTLSVNSEMRMKEESV